MLPGVGMSPVIMQLILRKYRDLFLRIETLRVDSAFFTDNPGACLRMAYTLEH